MAIIYSYPLNDDIKPLDELVGTTEKNINGQLKTVTRNFLLQDLAEFFIVDGGLQKTITLTTDGSSGVSTLDQVTGVLNIPNYSDAIPTAPGLQEVLDVNYIAIKDVVLEVTNPANTIQIQATPYQLNFIKISDNSQFQVDGFNKRIVNSNNDSFSILNFPLVNGQYPSFNMPSKPSGTYTLATLDDIPSVTGFVPYTGATDSVDLGYNPLLTANISINGNSPTGGSYLGFKHSTSVNTGNNGYTSIYTFGTNTIGFKSISDDTTIDFSFSMASITPGIPGGRTYTLPDASGTVALTSDIPTTPSLQSVLDYNHDLIDGKNFQGTGAGSGATNAGTSNFIGQYTGFQATDANNSNFLGANAGYGATGAYNSNFFGSGTGFGATSAPYSNFLGPNAGYQATNSNNSNFIGQNSGYLATDAYNSNFFGQGSGYGATDAHNSNFIGNQSGSIATNAYNSNFLGSNAGFQATNASNSNFFGSDAGYQATNSNNSNFLGQQAGYLATNASYSNFFGYQAGAEATNASQSNFFGYLTGFGATDAYDSNFIGANTGYGATGASSSNFLGQQAGYLAVNASGSNFFGVYAGANATDAYQSNFIGPYAGYLATSAYNSNFIGNGAGLSATGACSSNFLGAGAGSSATNAYQSNFIGNQSGFQATNANDSNFLGLNAGYGAINANNSNFLSAGAGAGATNAFQSNFIGLNAGYGVTNAHDSNFFGALAGYQATNASQSNFFGQYAGYNATDASNSNFFGNAAGQNATNANNSNLFGFQTGLSFTDNNIGSNNIIIGTNISLPDATTNSINLGGVLFGTGTYSTAVGNPSIVPTAGGRIGIGVVTPTNTLHIYSETADTSGLRLERLTSTSPISTGQAIGVDANGNVVTVDIPSVTGFVPYTGATDRVDLGINNLYLGSGNDGAKIIMNGSKGTNYIDIENSGARMVYQMDSIVYISKQFGGTKTISLFTDAATGNDYSINFPDASGTVALTSDIPSSGVTSVGVSMPSAFTVTNSPITTSGTIGITGAGVVSQYIRGDGSLANFPQASGGGSSVSYYLNGSVSQGTFGGIAFKEINRTPVVGAGTDFTISTDGYIQSFITDANDPNQLLIPAGNWNFETYFSASSGGGSPSFYIELYKYNGSTLTLIASNSASPELITGGTNIDLYFTALAIPQTTLALTDRLAVRFYVTHSGRTITMHTEDNHLSQIITTFTTGLTALNGLTSQVQNFATGTTGTNFAINSSGSTHTFNLPDASATARGVVTTGDQTFAGIKTFSTIKFGASSLLFEYFGTPVFTSGSGATLNIGGGPGTAQNNLAVPNGTFNIGLQTASTIASFDASKNVVSLTASNGYPTLSELKWLAGTTSSIQTQLSAKVTSVTGTAPVVSSGGTTPAISMAAATASVDGYLTAANFTAFNNKVSAQTGQIILTSGTSTILPAAITAATIFRIELVGGGGGGAGGLAGGGSGTGGGGGGYVYKQLTGFTAGETLNYTIGAAGTAGASGANGGDGGSTTLTKLGVTYTASGGIKGVATNSTVGSAGGTGTNGDINITGQSSADSQAASGVPLSSGGGNSPKGWGNGGLGTLNGNAGRTATGYGGGGSSARGSTGSLAGGAGTQGIIVITWFN